MKKFASLLLAVMMLVFLVSCGGGESKGAEYVGKYNCVWANVLDVELTGEDVPVKSLELKADGKCVWTADDGTESEYDYEVDGTTLKISSYGLDYATGTVADGKIDIPDWMGLGFAYKFEKAN